MLGGVTVLILGSGLSPGGRTRGSARVRPPGEGALAKVCAGMLCGVLVVSCGCVCVLRVLIGYVVLLWWCICCSSGASVSWSVCRGVLCVVVVVGCAGWVLVVGAELSLVFVRKGIVFCDRGCASGCFLVLLLCCLGKGLMCGEGRKGWSCWMSYCKKSGLVR